MNDKEERQEIKEKPRFSGKNAYAKRDSKEFMVWHIQNRRKRRKAKAEEE